MALLSLFNSECLLNICLVNGIFNELGAHLMFIELRIKQQNESFHFVAVFLQRQRCLVPHSCNFLAAAPFFQLFFCAAGHSNPCD